MEIVHTSIRQFMPPGHEEPNIHYRPRLEQHIGKQGVDWDWDLCRTDIDSLCIMFNDTNSATFFELTWNK